MGNKIHLCSFKPMLLTKEGRHAVDQYGLPPYIDGSCRREPDFESKYPSISALCRSSNFAPHIQEGDNVVYITVKGKYQTIDQKHWRLISILKVIKRFESHKEASEWYVKQGVSIPNNCMIDGNLPYPLEKTFGVHPSNRFGEEKDPERLVHLWNLGYRHRAKIR